MTTTLGTFTNPYPLGSQIRITGTFTNLLTGVLQDPADPTLYLAQPGQAGSTAYTTSNGVVHDSLGVYHYDLLLNLSGVWVRAWASKTGLIAAEDDLEIHVANSRLR